MESFSVDNSKLKKPNFSAKAGGPYLAKVIVARGETKLTMSILRVRDSGPILYFATLSCAPAPRQFWD